MIRRSIYRYYWFGTCVRYLQDAPVGHTVLTAKPGGIRNNINAFFKYLDELERFQ